jgi:hypothetical protein
MPPRGGTAHGFSLVEVVVATLLLAACLVPAATALRTGLALPDVAADAGSRLGCVKAAMEEVMAEPYVKLYAAARSRTVATTYSRPQTPACPAIAVYVTSYNPTTATFYASGTDTDLLYIRVRLADAALGTASAYTLTSLVAH